MSRENMDALQSLYKRWGTGDWSAVSIFAPDVFDPYAVGVFPDPSPSPAYGVEAISAYMRRFLGTWNDVRMQAMDYRTKGDTVVVRVRRLARGKGSGISMEDEAFHVWTFRGGLVIRVEVFEREAEALEAAGLSE